MPLRLPRPPGAIHALCLTVFLCFPGTCPAGAAPTELRAWTSSSGTRIQAQATVVQDGVVQLLTTDQRLLKVPLDKFAADDQALLRKHFGIVAADGIPPAAALQEDTSISLPKGQPQGPIEAGPGSSYHLYLPKSLPQGRKHPLMMILNPHHGNNGTLTRYQPGAERNGWILITSVESANEVDPKVAVTAIVKAIDHAKSTLPVDPGRVFLGGFSGGSSRSFRVAAEVDAAGILACGMGVASNIQLKRDVPIYILSGSNCWNRSDPGTTLAMLCPKSKDSLARYFPGNHDWASAELMEDGMTHLHATVLANRRDRYPDEAQANAAAILQFAGDLRQSNPARALMWTTFLNERPTDSKLLPALRKLHTELAKDPQAVRWVEGLKAIHRFAVDKLGKEELEDRRNGWAKCGRDLQKLATEYADTPWKETLDRMLAPAVPPQ